jgi:hypothetical protein
MVQKPQVPPTQPTKGISLNLKNILLAFMQRTDAYMSEINSTLKNHGASLNNLEIQMGQISRQLSERQEGKFLMILEKCHAITLRCGKVASPPPSKI